MPCLNVFRRLLTPLLCIALCSLAGTAHAQRQPLSDDELGGVWGQALISLTNSSYDGLDFSRLTLDSTIQLSATLNGLRLGEYTRNGTAGSDIDLGTLRFGRSDATEAQRTVTIVDPYFEFIYKNSSNAATREVVGLRLGFGSISGDIGLTMNSVSGNLLIDAGSAGTVSSANSSTGGVRWDGSCASCTLLLSQIGAVRAGNSSGASRDFFISLLKQSVNFAAASADLAAPATAQAGFWLNWTDRLSALNTTGVVPPNVAKVGP